MAITTTVSSDSSEGMRRPDLFQMLLRVKALGHGVLELAQKLLL